MKQIDYEKSMTLKERSLRMIEMQQLKLLKMLLKDEKRKNFETKCF